MDQAKAGHRRTVDNFRTDCLRELKKIKTPGRTCTTRRSLGRCCSLHHRLWRPRFSWTRIKGESDVKGGGGHGWVEEGEGSCVARTEGALRASGVGADGAAVGAGALAPWQRWSASRKRDVVLRLLRGESLDTVSREVGVELYRLEAWQARALGGLELGLKEQAGEPLAAELDAAKRHIGELSMEIELLRERARAAERRLPLAPRRSRR